MTTSFWVLTAIVLAAGYLIGHTIAGRDDHDVDALFDPPDCGPGQHVWREHPSTRRFCQVCGYREKQVVRDEVFDQDLAPGTDFAKWEAER